MSIRLLSVGADDAEALDILEIIHREAFDALDERGWSAAELRATAAMPGSHIRLAVARDAPVGFILFRRTLDEAELITLAVRPACQGQGAARHLLLGMATELEGQEVAKVFLEVRADNDRAITLYRQTGFVECGKRPAYYQTHSGNRIDALCLCLILNKSPDFKEK